MYKWALILTIMCLLYAAASTIYIGVAAGSVSLCVLVVVVVVVATALVKKNRLCTLKVVQEGEA